jgi:hypothetical protein
MDRSQASCSVAAAASTQMLWLWLPTRPGCVSCVRLCKDCAVEVVGEYGYARRLLFACGGWGKQSAKWMEKQGRA